ncbi:MAG: serine hydrolase [Sphingobacteriaceae bacterium]|nr:serine hydrolase [Sphingobacteriaceae bacterium]
MKKLIISLVFFLVTAFGYSQVVAEKSIDSIMKVAYQRGIFNGNILVAQRGKVIYEQSFGFADGTKSLPMKKDLRFDIGSISKEFNGVAIMLLNEKGNLSLDDKLSKYFPEFPAWANDIKIRHLINYTSGIPVFGPAGDGNDSLIYQSLLQLKSLKSAPGSLYIYNAVNVSLQRKIIEKVSGMSYASFLKKYLFKPAGMQLSLVDYPVDANGMARAFDEQGKTTVYEQQTNGWVRLPINDLYKWITALDHNKIISPASFRELSKAFPGGESSIGTSEFKDDTLLWHQHQGSNSNYEAAYYSNVKDRIVIIMMTNNQQMKVWSLKTAILQALGGQNFTIPKKSLYLAIRDRMLADTASGMSYYRKLKKEAQEQFDFSFEIGDLISTGKYLQRRKKFDEAILLFNTAVALKARTEDLSYGYELMGECFYSKGEVVPALTNYQKSLDLNPMNKNSAEMVKKLGK